jgi:thioesterase domain-containing protein
MDARGGIRPDRLAAIEAYLHEHIPVSAAMEVRVDAAEPDLVTLSAPLEPNVNHRSTVFGGSCASVAILAAWTLLHLHASAVRPARVVIQHGATDYLAPITGRFAATCRTDAAGWQRFDAALLRKGRARIDLVADVECQGEDVARFRGTYVAIVVEGTEQL